ncbi:hypothetical protein K437DRAFT_109334 [Tilletiaria anomala UBC 951]|uniref:Uncharacterized protein n=1 Tax=Tilletiaria anomala (strain ATCC 24038 / CBS 436.72 / UBC 951) TaxID=1037660 RepID=A0A066W5G1_TILAU|nr:uncharacterized protein K437DRAFT_109334 [Tilletiaria anomala UBC 951]KDN46304.1 hypothetical protein K437DRAFT_109334 [Tilletiaria anomala UBC 951]
MLGIRTRLNLSLLRGASAETFSPLSKERMGERAQVPHFSLAKTVFPTRTQSLDRRELASVSQPPSPHVATTQIIFVVFQVHTTISSLLGRLRTSHRNGAVTSPLR